jgi:sodium-coupled neutral amino acid transporter 2
MPRLFPAVTDATSIFNLFTVVPVFVTAYICHYNGMHFIRSFMSNIFLIRLFYFIFYFMFLCELDL